MDKKSLRKEIRLLKARHTEEELLSLSADICSRLLRHPLVIKSETILMYWSLSDEVDTHHLVEHLFSMGKTILLPKVISDTEMTIHRYSGIDSMVEGSFGILEPNTPTVSLSSSESLLAIIPGMSFDDAGHRLGRGKGYYDRFLSAHPYIYKIGVCFPFQKKDVIPTDEYDVVMDEVL